MIYSNKLTDYILKTKNIPRLITCSSIKKYNLYYSPYIDKIFRCIDIYEINNIKYYEVEFDKMRHIIPFNSKDEVYVIYNNKKRKVTNIFNNKYYYGFEIIYWFVVNKIDLYSEEYRLFKTYIDNDRGNNQINPNEKYKVIYKKEKDRYVVIFIKKK